MSLVLRFAAGSHKGLIREGNEDSGFAGPRLLAVADGMGGAAAGEVASSEVLSSIIGLNDVQAGPDLPGLLGEAVHQANERLRLMVEQDPQLEGMGCTLTALLWTGDRMGLAHVGDSRAYLLRDGSLTQITQDHTWVQRLVDEGRITPEEAETHPQRSLLMRALDGRGQVEPDLAVLEVRAGDRYLICSDGLSGPVSHQTLEETLGSYYAPDATIQELIQLALRGGGPDNITCVVADVIEVGATDTLSGQFTGVPVAVGAVAEGPHGTATDLQVIDTPAGRAAGLGRPQAPQGAFGPADGYQEGYDGSQGAYEPGYDQGQGGYGPPADYAPGEHPPEGYPGGAEPAGDYPPEQPPARKRRWFRRSTILVVAVGLVGGAAYAGWQWTQGQYYLTVSNQHVTVYQGISQDLVGLRLSKAVDETDIDVQYLPAYQQSQLKNTIDASSLSDANQRVQDFRAQAAVCSKLKTAGATTVSAAAYYASPKVGAPRVGASPPAAPTQTPTVPAQATPPPSAPAAPSSPPALSADEQKLAGNCP